MKAVRKMATLGTRGFSRVQREFSVLAEDGRHIHLKFSRGFASHTRKKNSTATQAITSGVSSRAHHLSHALYFLCAY